MMNRRMLLGLLATSPLLARPAFAASPDVFSDDGLAIGGIDPVGYFDQGAAVMGDPAHALMWKGTTWQFETAETLARFEADPDAYAPQYGGYCAYAVSQGYIASTDPDAWTIHEGKLYLNYSQRVRRTWSRDIPGNIVKANGNWPSVLNA